MHWVLVLANSYLLLFTWGGKALGLVPYLLMEATRSSGPRDA